MVGNVRESRRQFFGEFLGSLCPDAFGAVHIERHADDEFLHLVLVGELPKPFEVRLPGGVADGFHALGGPAEEVAHGDPDGDTAHVKTHDTHIRGPCALRRNEPVLPPVHPFRCRKSVFWHRDGW